MQELTVSDIVTWIQLGISVISLLILIAVYYDSKKKERIRKEEMEVKALGQCHTLLKEAIRLHPDLNYPLAFVMSDEFPVEINKKADALTELSWVCTDLGEDIRKGASILKSSVQVIYAAADGYLTNKERSDSLEIIKNLRDKIDVRLKK